MLAHGGNLSAAAKDFGIPEADWLDLSTGLNPVAWQLNSPIPTEYLTRLPYPDSQLQEAATRYFSTTNILPIAGSQAAIQMLPQIIKSSTVAVPSVGYEEHRYHWHKNGHTLQAYNPYQDDLITIAQQSQPSVILVINPNNPTAHLHSRETLLKLLNIVESYGGLLIVDEAFIDTQPENSLSTTESESLIILRSIGKFFGLPGIRTGFVIACQHWLDKIESALGPWTLSGPSQWIATQCLNDKAWQQQAMKSLKGQATEQAAMLSNELERFGIGAGNSTDYFISFTMTKNIAEQMKVHFGKQGILVRSIELDTQRSLLRFGLCANPDAVAKVQRAASSLLLT
ncbi:threonine-phosphate decarboxylase CobD [Alkalimarinus sediminis]|uniref:threonine-phosphate decarboxylase n=1 Tax=Alkalimarinus sediminis TaxID=1632866 RepID=A0A9E8HL93_9ALTE|nr:threonine-phosphate decarboxylase CobD [Alkalimarinus sediminis]UZW74926.1 threonine-phosphate decarboxylase CobD [Alkalimarinus sediminis]